MRNVRCSKRRNSSLKWGTCCSNGYALAPDGDICRRHADAGGWQAKPLPNAFLMHMRVAAGCRSARWRARLRPCWLCALVTGLRHYAAQIRWDRGACCNLVNLRPDPHRTGRRGRSFCGKQERIAVLQVCLYKTKDPSRLYATGGLPSCQN